MKLTISLDTAWTDCLAMWKYIANTYAKTHEPAVVLKTRWLRGNGYEPRDVVAGCLFCHYDSQCDNTQMNCSFCPGELVDPFFSCECRDYNWRARPIEFYEKLLALDSLRHKSS